MAHTVLFSIIVPVYNVEPYLRRCVNSILKQSLSDFECILINDGSTDKSGEICDEFARLDPRILVIHSENRGVSAARNLGLERASGEYIVFVDSDDWIGEKYLQDLTGSEADYFCESFFICDENEKIEKEFKLTISNFIALDKEMMISILKTGAARYPFSKRFKSDIIQKGSVRFDESIVNSEDTLFIVDYLLYCKDAEFFNASNYYYVRYRSRTTLSNRISLERLSESSAARSKIAGRLFEKGSEGYNDLYFFGVSFPYVHYLWSVFFNKTYGILNNYFFGIRFMNNPDVRKVIRYSPDALWVLPVSQRTIRAYISNSRFKLLIACILDKFNH